MLASGFNFDIFATMQNGKADIRGHRRITVDKVELLVELSSKPRRKTA